jgi:hypothetical protein
MYSQGVISTPDLHVLKWWEILHVPMWKSTEGVGQIRKNVISSLIIGRMSTSSVEDAGLSKGLPIWCLWVSRHRKSRNWPLLGCLGTREHIIIHRMVCIPFYVL